ncbi:MAG TPA: efflux RND transporter periplasmic adaptor subunit [Bacteroidales bacterium]|nr:efflux RND transporter periplasmic adaptor subunit [Bacteroidales bacterium]HPE56660.1 efflux RND transporter periplasmic adaptor subunit [Bacteroidales bacterium]HRX97203.1 efflux RND transporter periplasmic adaptor subunit [Bacteroidales bacterium]
MKKLSLALLLAVLFISCEHQESGEMQSGELHEEETEGTHEETRSVTLYSKNYEIFTEYGALHQGEPSNFLIHITKLDAEYSAFADGQVKVKLMFNDGDQQETAVPAKVAGIFNLTLTPEKAGDAFLNFIIQSNSGSDILDTEVHVLAKGETDHHVEESSGSYVRYTKEQAWKSRFNVAEVRTDSFAHVIKASGEFLAMPGEKQSVTAKSQGVVLFGSKDLVQGKHVQKGEVLFTLSGEGLANNNIAVQFSEAKTNFEKSKADLERHQRLLTENIISERQFLETQSRYFNDSIRYYSLKETVGTCGMKVRAPMSGYLHELNVSEGAFVSPGNLMATISTNRVILLRADVPQQFYGVLDKVTTTTFRPAYTHKVYTLEELSGRLMARGASVAENNHYLPVYFEVVNDGTLLEGAFAEFFLKTDPEPDRIVIPMTALIEEQGNYFVYVQVSGESYEKRAVAIEATDGIHAAIASGLQPGERIVTEGAMLVKTATSAALPAHNHQH